MDRKREREIQCHALSTQTHSQNMRQDNRTHIVYTNNVCMTSETLIEIDALSPQTHN
jgi:hypothetical protein